MLQLGNVFWPRIAKSYQSFGETEGRPIRATFHDHNEL